MSNIFNRQTTALKLPDSVEINDNTNSLSTSSSAAPSFVAGGSAIIEKDLKVDDIAYLNECRINTLPTSIDDTKQAFTNYVSLVGQKINNKDTLLVQGDVKATGEIQATTISGLINAPSIQSTGNVQAGSFNGDSASISNNIGAGSITCSGAVGAGSINVTGAVNCQDLKINDVSISSSYAPATGSANYVSSTTSQTQNRVLAAPSTANGAPTFRSLVAADIPTLDYVSSTTSQTQNRVLAAPSSADGVPTFRALVANDIPDLSSKYQPDFPPLPKNYVFASSTYQNNQKPGFRSIVPDDFSDTPANLILAGPASAANLEFNVGKNTFRNLVPADFGTTDRANLILGGNASNGPTFRNVTHNDFNAQSPNSILAGPTSGTDSTKPTFRALVSGDIPDLSSKYPALPSTRNSNTILAFPSNATATTPAAFRHITPADFGTVPHASASRYYLTVSPTSGATPFTPEWSTIDSSSTDVEINAVAVAGFLFAGTSSNMPKQAPKTFYAGPLQGDANAAPKFRLLTADDIPPLSYASASPQLKNLVLAGPSSTESPTDTATPTFRALVAADIPTLDYAPTSDSPNYVSATTSQTKNKVLAAPVTEDGPPSFRDLHYNDMPSQMKELYTQQQSPGDFTVLAGRGSKNFNFLTVTPEPSTGTFHVTFYHPEEEIHSLQNNYTTVRFNKDFGNVILANTDYTIWYYSSYSFSIKDESSVDVSLYPTIATTVQNVEMTVKSTKAFFRKLDFGDMPFEVIRLHERTPLAAKQVLASPIFPNVIATTITPNTTTGVFTITGATLNGLMNHYSKLQFSKDIGGVIAASSHYLLRSWTSTSFTLHESLDGADPFLMPTNNTVVSNVQIAFLVSAPVFRSLHIEDMPTEVKTPLTTITSSQTSKTFFSAPTAANGAPTFRIIEYSDLPGFPNGRLINTSSNGVFLGSAYYPTTSWTFTSIKVTTSSNTINLVSNVAGTPTLGTTVLQINTGIQFNSAFSSIAALTTYYIKTFSTSVTGTGASAVTTYNITISDTLGGATKSITALTGGLTSVSSSLSIANYPTTFRIVTSADVRSASSAKIVPNPSYNPEDPESSPTMPAADEPSNIVILDEPQLSNRVLAAPNGGDGIPSFRSLVAADIPDLSLLYAPKDNSPNYAPAFSSQEANTFFAAPNGSFGNPTFRTLVAADIPALAYAPIINGNQSLTADTNHTIDASLYTYTTWSSGASGIARTFHVINLIPGTRTIISVYNFSGVAKTISFTASSTGTTGSAPLLSKGDAGGTFASSVTLSAASGIATVEIYNIAGIFRGSIT